MQAKLSKDKTALLLILGLPVGIILLSTFVYFTGIGMPNGTANHGVLITPPKQLQQAGVEFTEAPSSSRPMWTLLQVASDTCDTSCLDDLVYSRQLRTSLGRRTPGLRRLLWADISAALTAQLKADHSDLVIQALPNDSQLSSLFGEQPRRYYLIDPKGFLMMYYTEEQNYKQMTKDLKFLLTRSGY